MVILEDKLKSVFSIINDLTKFAEAKNAAVVTLCGAGIWGILQLIKDSNKLTEYKYVLLFMLCVFFISLIISLKSFIAKTTNNSCPKGQHEDITTLNLLFYGDICKLTPEEYLENIYNKYDKPKIYSSCSLYEQDLANQIVVNSEIVMNKYSLFNLSIKILLSGIIFSLFGIILIYLGGTISLDYLSDYFLLCISYFIIFTVIKQLLKENYTLRFLRRISEIKFLLSLNSAFRFKESNIRFRISETIINHKFHTFNYAIFLMLIVKKVYLKEAVSNNIYIGYFILLWFLAYATYWSNACRNSAKSSKLVWIIIYTLANLCGYSYMWLVLISMVSQNMNFFFAIIAILFCFLPSFFMAMTMLDTIEYSLARISIAYIFTVIVGAYTLLIFGIHDKVILKEAIEGDFINSVLTLIKFGADNISQTSLSDITENRLDRLFQVLIGIFGGFVISYVTSVANKPKAEPTITIEDLSKQN